MEDITFIQSITTGVKDRNNIEYVLETAKLLDGLYESTAKKRKIVF